MPLADTIQLNTGRASMGAAASLECIAVQAREGERHLVDQYGRRLFLRGVSLSGLSKLPATPDGSTHQAAGFFDHRSVSFVDRPFPLDEADEHFERLATWGLTLIRLVVCWEAIEHAGPGEYDMDYVTYVHSLVKAAKQWGIKVIIDAHQDVWSRLSGGSGAPGWTLELAGFDIKGFQETGAAALHQLGSPTGIWPSGYQKLAAATMFTLFFSGNIFAYLRKVPRRLHKKWAAQENSDLEVGLQDFLQEAMIEAFAVLANELKDEDCVIGVEPMNEPHRGYANLHSPFTWNHNTDLAIHNFPNFLQSLALGSGYPQKVPFYVPSWPLPTRKSHDVLLSPPRGRSAWLPGYSCIWREHGVWEWSATKQEAFMMRSSYFCKDPRTGNEFEWYRDAWCPFAKRFGEAMISIRKDWLIPVASVPNEYFPVWPKELQPPNMISAPHFYDLHSLFTKSHGNMTVDVQGLSRGMPIWKALYFGRKAAKTNYAQQIKNIVEASYKSHGEIPCFVGEVGLCMDMNKASAFQSGDFQWQIRQLDALINAMEVNFVSFALWNYNPSNQPEHGDSWNGENFSIFSPATHKGLGLSPNDPVHGSLVHQALLRPYAVKVAGTPISTSFDIHTTSFSFKFHSSNEADEKSDIHSSDIKLREMDCWRTTEIFLPVERYPRKKTKIIVTDGDFRYVPDISTLFWKHAPSTSSKLHEIRISVDGSPQSPTDWFDWFPSSTICSSILVTLLSFFIWVMVH